MVRIRLEIKLVIKSILIFLLLLLPPKVVRTSTRVFKYDRMPFSSAHASNTRTLPMMTIVMMMVMMMMMIVMMMMMMMMIVMMIVMIMEMIIMMIPNANSSHSHTLP
jgi:hypothetical protein